MIMKNSTVLTLRTPVFMSHRPQRPCYNRRHLHYGLDLLEMKWVHVTNMRALIMIRARARQPRFGSSMQYCIRSLISITNVQRYCKWAKVFASLLLWHFKTIWLENICLPFIEVHCSNQQKLFHFAHRGFSYFLISTQNFNKWRPNVVINILVLTNA